MYVCIYVCVCVYMWMGCWVFLRQISELTNCKSHIITKCSTKTMETVIDLIGCSIHDREVDKFIQSIASTDSPLTPSVVKYSDVTFYNYVQLGLSVECRNDSDSTIEAVHCYASQNNSKNFVCAFQGPIPCELKMNMDNKQIVTMFGEPDRKGGGSIPVWISYEEPSPNRKMPMWNRRGFLVKLQVDFLHKSWDLVPNPVAHYTFWITLPPSNSVQSTKS